MQTDFERKMDLVVAALQKAGYDPLRQLEGYCRTGDPAYITRKDDARSLIESLDLSLVCQYIKTL